MHLHHLEAWAKMIFINRQYKTIKKLRKAFDCSIGINSLTILGHIVNEKSKEG